MYFEGCPNWATADRRLAELSAELGFELRRRTVTTPEEAEAVHFLGSPTILIDGDDPFAAPGEACGLSCRVYETPDGLTGSPTTDQLRAALGG